MYKGDSAALDEAVLGVRNLYSINLLSFCLEPFRAVNVVDQLIGLHDALRLPGVPGCAGHRTTAYDI